MISHENNGGRTVHLFIPFEFNKKRIEAVVLAPLRLGHVLGWGEGQYKTMIELLVDLSGLDQTTLRELRYPDADRVVETFMAMLTPEIRNDIIAGKIPLKPEDIEDQALLDALRSSAAEGKANGSGQPAGPGVPLPPEMQAGFDMSEEP